MLPRPRRELRPRRQVGGQPDDLEPAVGVGHEDEPAIGQPADTALPVGALADRPFLPVGDRHDRDAGGVADRVGPVRGDRQPRPVRRPVDLLDVDPRRRHGASRFRARRRAGSPAAGYGRVHDPDLGPATPPGDEREPPPVRRPARDRFAGRVMAQRDEPRAIRVDDGDRSVADEREPPSVRRPARIRDRLLGRGDLGRRPAAQRQDEELAGAGRFVRVGHGSAARIEPELARRLGGDDVLDRQGVRRPAREGRLRRRATGGGRVVGRPAHPCACGAGQPTRAHHGPIIASGPGRGRAGPHRPSSSHPDRGGRPPGGP